MEWVDVYSGREIGEVEKVRRAYLWLFWGGFLVAAAICVLSQLALKPSFYAGAMVLNIAVTTLYFSGLLFLYGTKYRYVKYYFRMLKHLASGLKAQGKGVFSRVEPTTTVHDGVEFRVLIVREDVVKRPDLPERRLLLDSFLELPALSEGDKLEYTTCGSVLLKYKLL